MKLNEKGITLIEMIISIAILSIVSVMAFSIIIMGAKHYERETRYSNNQQNVRSAARTIGKEVRRANKVHWDSTKLNEIKLEYKDNSTCKFKLDGDKIVKTIADAGGVVASTSDLAKDISEFKSKKVNDEVTLEIKSKDVPSGTMADISSTINIRKSGK